MNRWIKCIAACPLLALTACTNCYPVNMESFADTHGAGVIFNEKSGVDFNPGHPPMTYCGPMPEFGIFTYGFKGKGPIVKLPAVPIRQNMPKGFMSNPGRLLYLELDSKKNPHVMFGMRLSATTTKLIEHEETPEEKLQRLQDEKLFIAIKNHDVQGVKMALANHASVIQPWTNVRYFLGDRRDIHAIFDYAMASHNLEIIAAVLAAGAPFREEEASTAFIHDYTSQTNGPITWAFVDTPTARELLKNGANPNYGSIIEFAMTREVYKRPGMPANADYLPIPIDRNLYRAVSINDPELVRALLEYGAETQFRLPASREPPDWWKDGEWFMDWVAREASPEVKRVFAEMKGKPIKKPERNNAIKYNYDSQK